MKTFNTQKLATVLAISAALMVGVSQAQAASDTGTATATVYTPIAVSAGADLDFGAFSIVSADSIAINASTGARTQSGSGVVLSADDAGQRGTFSVTGQSGASFAITLPADSSVTIGNGTDTMAVDGFASTASGTLTGGSETVGIGATLTVLGTESTGSYTGTFNVSVEYN